MHLNFVRNKNTFYCESFCIYYHHYYVASYLLLYCKHEKCKKLKKEWLCYSKILDNFISSYCSHSSRYIWESSFDIYLLACLSPGITYAARQQFFIHGKRSISSFTCGKLFLTFSVTVFTRIIFFLKNKSRK